MDRYLFNIPLLETFINSDGRTIQEKDTLEIVRHAVLELFGHDAHVVAHAVHESSKGPVLVMELHAPAAAFGSVAELRATARVAELAYTLCIELGHGTIAWGRMSARGRLAYTQFNGPALTLWSNFTPEYFLLLDGSKAT